MQGSREKMLDLVFRHKKLPQWFYKNLIKSDRNEQHDFAQHLCRLAGVSLDQAASLNDLPKFEAILGVNVLVISARAGNKFIRRAVNKNQRKNVYLYLVENNGLGHFHAITKIAGFFSTSYFCELCLQPYAYRKKHQCEMTCIICNCDNCPVGNNTITCKDCNMTCRSKDCFQRHKRLVKKRGRGVAKSLCEQWWRCPKCKKVLEVAKRNPRLHSCSEWECNTCNCYFVGHHFCHQRGVKAKDTSKFKYIFFDFECRQDQRKECQEGYVYTEAKRCVKCQDDPEQCEGCKTCNNCNDVSCGKFQHTPNYVVAQKVCNDCQDKDLSDKCTTCGNRCDQCDKRDPKSGEFAKMLCNTCGDRQTIFQGDDTALQFGKFIFHQRHKDSTIMAHNLKGYDGYFLLEYLISQSMYPRDIIYSGSKIMYMLIGKGLNIRLIDSLNFMSMSLGSLPKSFGLNEMFKGWFPHFFNTKENQSYVGPYPPPDTYGVSFMSSDERERFFTWYNDQKGEFNFREEMKSYCISDVDILRQACMSFRKLMIEVTGLDPFAHVTIASVCMAIYKTNFVEEEYLVTLNHKRTQEVREVQGKLKNGVWSYLLHPNRWSDEAKMAEDWTVQQTKFIKSPIAQVPPGGYHRDQYSLASIRWLEWMKHSQNMHIQHALNDGEYQIPSTNFKADGYDPNDRHVLEFLGCVYHGCLKCFKDRNAKSPMTKQSFNELYTLTKMRETKIKSLGYKYTCIWECEFNDQVSRHPDMKAFMNNLDIQERLNPRDSFFGGRTNASKLHHKVQDGEEIRYVDFTSLYPWVNKYCKYPVGHPTILTGSDLSTDISQYFGIAKVKVLPPKGLYHPVLPYRSNGKLKFALCQTCGDTENQQRCTCNNEARSFLGTWCTPELAKAVEKGYEILKVYEVYHWDETTMYDPINKEGGLFSQYIDTFLKLKQEASGWPTWCDTTEKKETYVKNYKDNEGIELDASKIEKNPGLRSLAKLCLNSFWGKFGQRLDMNQTSFVHESEVDKFFTMLTNPEICVKDFNIVAPDLLQVQYSKVQEAMTPDAKTNIFLASFTTCWARLKLYEVLNQLGERVFYYDTDSIIYLSKPGDIDVPIGDYLGQLTDELDGHFITEFISAGPKNYAYNTSDNKQVCKVRGFTLNYRNSQIINFDSVKELVTVPDGNQSLVTVNPNKICRDKNKFTLLNRCEEKKYRMVYTKRVLQPDFTTLPYGY